MRWIALVMVVGLAAGCGDPDPDRVPGPNALDDQAPETVAQVDITADGFDPSEVSLESAQGIELTNASDEEVRVIGRLGDDPRYDTGTMHPDDTTTLVFVDPGRYDFTFDGAEDDGVPFVVTVTPAPAGS